MKVVGINIDHTTTSEIIFRPLKVEISTHFSTTLRPTSTNSLVGIFPVKNSTNLLVGRNFDQYVGRKTSIAMVQILLGIGRNFDLWRSKILTFEGRNFDLWRSKILTNEGRNFYQRLGVIFFFRHSIKQFTCLAYDMTFCMHHALSSGWWWITESYLKRWC